MKRDTAAKTFVLVHGAYHGGWCWERVADVLRSRGHRVTAPTQTGLGERSHLLSEAVSLSVFIDDIVNHLLWENLSEVVLVGHSFGGVVITGVADTAPERLTRLIYLDAVLLENDEAPFDLLPEDIGAARVEAAYATSGGLAFPAPPAESFGLSDPADVAFVERRLTPHPLATYRDTLRLHHAFGNGLPIEYVMCTDPAYALAAILHGRARDGGWPVTELATGHDAMVAAPAATADLLEALSG